MFLHQTIQVQMSDDLFEFLNNSDGCDGDEFEPIETLEGIIYERLSANPNEFTAQHQVNLDEAYASAAEQIADFLVEIAQNWGTLYLVGSVANRLQFTGTDIDLLLAPTGEIKPKDCLKLNFDPYKYKLSKNSQMPVTSYFKEILTLDKSGNKARWYLVISFQANNSVRVYMFNMLRFRNFLDKGSYNKKFLLFEIKTSDGENPVTPLALDPIQNVIYKIGASGLYPHVQKPETLVVDEDGIDKSGTMFLRTVDKAMSGDQVAIGVLRTWNRPVTFKYTDLLKKVGLKDPRVDYFLHITLNSAVLRLLHKPIDRASGLPNLLFTPPNLEILEQIHPVLRFFPLIALNGGMDAFLREVIQSPISQKFFPNSARVLLKTNNINWNVSNREFVKYIKKALLDKNPISLGEMIFSEEANRFVFRSAAGCLNEYFPKFLMTLMSSDEFALFLIEHEVFDNDFVDLVHRIATAVFIFVLKANRTPNKNMTNAYKRWKIDISRK